MMKTFRRLPLRRMRSAVVTVFLTILITVFLMSAFLSQRWSSPTFVRTMTLPKPEVNGANLMHINEKPKTVKTSNQRVDHESIDKAAIRKRDLHALFLSEQKTPPFDPDFKNPCWWFGESNSTLACLPYFFLAGFPKCATTDLHYRMVQHPLIALPKIKEPHFVSRGVFHHDSCNRNISKYVGTSCDIFRHSEYFRKTASTIKLYKGGKIIPGLTAPLPPRPGSKHFKYSMITVDSSASTAWDNSNGHHIIRDIPLTDKAAKSDSSIIDWIVRMNPNVRIVVILRDPVSRSYSDYNYFNSKTTPEGFHLESVDFIQNFTKCQQSGVGILRCAQDAHNNSTLGRPYIAMYYIYIEEWLLRLPRDQIHVIRSEDYHKDMAKSLRDVFQFLDLPELSDDQLNKIVNSGMMNVNKKRVKPMWPHTRRKLIQFFRPFNAKLAALLKNNAFLWEDVYKQEEKHV